MPSPTHAVPEWVRCTICVIAAATVPGMLIVVYFGSPVSVGVSAVVGSFAIWSARLAFNAGKDGGKKQDPGSPDSFAGCS